MNLNLAARATATTVFAAAATLAVAAAIAGGSRLAAPRTSARTSAAHCVAVTASAAPARPAHSCG